MAMDDQQLAAQCEASNAQADSATIGFREWLQKIASAPKQKPYNYASTAWYRALDPLCEDKALLDRVLVAAHDHLVEQDVPVPPDPPVPPPVPGALPCGVSFGGIGYGDADRAKRQRMIADAKAMGAKVIRVQWWGQPENDNAIQDIIDAGLIPFVTVMIEYATSKITEQRASDEGRMFADKWGGKVRHVSFWNEPDLAGWDPEPWADCQLAFKNGARGSAKGSGFFIWSGDIWTWKMNSGSTTEGNFAWMKRAYDRWASKGLTGMPGDGFSPHSYGEFGWNDPRNALYGIWGPNGDGKATNCIRYLMDQRGDKSKPIASTECGHGTPSAQVSSVNAMFDMRDKGMQQGPLIYSQWDDAAGTFGMRPAEGQAPRAAYSTYTSRAGGVAAAAPAPSLATRMLSSVKPSQPKSAYEAGGDPWR